MATTPIVIDISDLQGMISQLQNGLSEKTFKAVMRSEFKRLSGRTRVIMKNDLPQEYYVSRTDASKAVKNSKVRVNVNGIGCVIPIKGPKMNIGSKFAATGSARGWESVHKSYRVRANIVKSGISTLPAHMENQGNQPPFRNIPSKLGNVTYTRAGEDRLPIVRVSGLAVPQMPMTRSREDVERDLHEVLEQRLDHCIQVMLTVNP